MKSEEIEQLLSVLREVSITDKSVNNILQKIRSDAMATKGGVQRLVRLACVPQVLKLLYRYLSMDISETEKEKSISERNVNTALSIVANLLMERDSRQQVKRDGMETIVTLLTDCSSEDVKIRCCRSLSNLAMDLPARAVMAQAKAVPALIKILEIQYVEMEKPVEKTKAPESPEDDAKDKSDDCECEEVDIEPRFPSVALVEAACKVLRYACGDNKVRQQLVEEGIVMRLAVLMKSDDSKMVAFVLRALSELWKQMNQRITEKMATEFSRTGVTPKLLELVDSEDDNVSQQAFTVLLPLAGHPRSAALIGASNGVEFFLSHLDSPRKHIIRKELISGLCLLAKEAVNRVKLRTSNGLKVFLETLQDDSLIDVQDRVISCLVSFLYDDSSLTAMLEDGLVNILLTHLQRCGNYTSDLTVNLFRNADAMLKSVANLPVKNTDVENTSPGDDSSVPAFENEDLDSSGRDILEKDSELLSGMTQSEPVLDKPSAFALQTQTWNVNVVKQPSESAVGAEELLEIQTSKSKISLEEESGAKEKSDKREDDSVEKTGSVRIQTYSMNSPTYQAETSWRMEDYRPGVTCKSYHTIFSPDSPAASSDDSRASSHYPYSPLSMHSYFSPTQPACLSLCSSPASSPPYSYTSPVQSPCASQGCASQFSSDGGVSEDLESTDLQLQALSPGSVTEMSPLSTTQSLFFSSSEEDDSVEDTTHCSTADGGTESSTKVSFYLGEDDTGSVDLEAENFLQDADGICHQSEKSKQTASQRHHVGHRFFKLRDSDCEPVTKRRKLQHEAGIHASVTQNNILILLSRLSVRDDLSKHLASSKVILCLTDHLAFADQPHDRCVRILSRVMTSPHCFTSLLKMCASAVLVGTLMLDSDLKLISHGLVSHARDVSSCGQMSQHLSVEENYMRSRSVMSVGFTTKTRRCISLSEDCSSTTTKRGKNVVHQQLSSDPDRLNLESKADSQGHQSGLGDKNSCMNLARTGTMLLEDLSNLAMSPYGEGVISYIFNCLSAADQLMCAVSLLFLQEFWPRERRQKFLIQQGAVEKVLSALCTQNAADAAVKDVLGLGLIYLSHGLHITPRFQSADLPVLLDKAVQSVQLQADPEQDSATMNQDGESTTSLEGEDCNYIQAEKDLKIVVRRGNSCRVLDACRATLVQNSSVFAKMLEGSYVESRQSEISVRDVCSKAMTSVLHYLHGCDGQCSNLKSLRGDVDRVNSVGQFAVTGERGTTSSSQLVQSHDSENVASKNRQLKHVLNTITVADRFLLPELVQYLCAAVSTSLINGSCAEQVFRFATFHGLAELAEDCIRMLLTSSHSVAETTSSLAALAEGEFGSAVKTSVLTFLKRGLASTP